MNDTRILLLSSGPTFLKSKSFAWKYEYMSKYFSGDAVTPAPRPDCRNNVQIGRFIIHPFPAYVGNSLIKNIYSLLHIFFISMKVYRCRRYDVVISSNPLITGLMALLISKLTGAKTIIEVNGNFEASLKCRREGAVKTGTQAGIKNKISKPIISFVLKRADMVKLVYKDQLKALENRELANRKKLIFHNFVAIKKFIESKKSDEKYILLLGHPWYLKGVDILIQAFNKICNDFPEYSLKIVGWCSEGKEFYEKLANGNPRIQLCDPVYYEDVIPLMSNCALYVLASRTDSSPRVLREAMASQKPIIAADVDGVPELIKDGYNGLLFRKEDADDLAEKIRLLLSNKSLAQKLAANGLEYVRKHLSEEVYVENYKRMVESTLNL